MPTDRLQDDLSDETADLEETVAAWSDEDVLALAKLRLPAQQAERMSELSDKAQRGEISKVEENELEIYLELYNNANLRKAYGIAEAVKRGLLNSPDDLTRDFQILKKFTGRLDYLPSRV